tara:strand:- start:80 stop:385 length:306 start_codon:yes stop_codon:yes gene_type:complete
MTIIASLLISTEKIIGEAINLHKSNKSYSDKLNELNILVTKINEDLSKSSEKIQFTETDKNLIRKISSQIKELENKNNASIDFFESLSEHFSSKANLSNKY